MAEIKIDGVTKEYPGGVRAVDDVRLTIASGEFMVLVGPSGCGKSTLLRMIAGLEVITGGDISIGDRVVTNLLAARPRHRDGLPELRALPAHARCARTSATACACARRRRTRSRGASTRSPACSASRTCSSAGPARSRAASASASRWAARSCASRRRSSWTSRSRTSTRSCASTCAASSPACTSGSA